MDVIVTGVCAFCGAKLTSGEFDWVVSPIEQDDYLGLHYRILTLVDIQY